MGRNVEIKAKIADAAGLAARLSELEAESLGTLDQTDSFFAAASGRLKLRECAGREAELIHYHRDDATAPRESNYEIAPVAEPERLKALLGAALGLLGVVRKRRRLYMMGQTRVHLDSVESLGEYMELEVVLREGQTSAEGRDIARSLQKTLGIADNDLVARAYFDLQERSAAEGSE
jgi:predicted adenylyl cyclase CyaB